MSQIAQLPRAQRADFSVADLERVYTERVLGPTCRHYFHHYSTRLQRYGKTGEKAACGSSSGGRQP